MRATLPIFAVIISSLSYGQGLPKDPNQQMREDVALWVETMSQIQREESDWARDNEVLTNYKEGLHNEIESLKQSVSEAQTRKEEAEKKTEDLSAQHERYTQARAELVKRLLDMERQLAAKLPLLPQPLATEPKVAQAIADLKSAAALPDNTSNADISERIYNLIELLAEVEKFQQQIHLTAELHKDQEGREFKLQIVYFGLAMAYGVNEDGSFAVVGTATRDGWKFTERTELAARIQQLVVSANEPKNATFTQLPLIKP